MAGTAEGGTGARTEEVPSRENQCQGPSYRAQYPADGERFLVVISRPDLVASAPFSGTDVARQQGRCAGMDTSDDVPHRYAWVKEIEAWTVAVVRGRNADDVIRTYGGDPAASPGELTFTELDELRAASGADVEFFAQVVPNGGHVVVIENDGYSGAFPEIARRCSDGGGSFLSVYWNIHAAGMVTQALDGAIAARFESLHPVAPDVRPWERRPEWAIGPEAEPGSAWQVCMAQVARQTGVVARPEWLTEPHPAYRIPEPYGLYHGVADADEVR